MNNINQQINKLKLILILSLMNKENQEETNDITQLLLLCIEAIANNYDSNSNHNSNKSSDEEINRNLCPSVLICENLCYEENIYNASGLLIYQNTSKESNIFYRTPWGYLGKNNTVTNESRYLVNYLSSTNGMTAEFESAGYSNGGYRSGMSAYNGSGFGMERGAMTQDIPATVDGQPLGEISIIPDKDTTIKDVDVEFSTYGTVAPTKIDIYLVNGFDKTKVLNYHRDTVGSIRAVTETDSSNATTIKWKGDYRPYGELLTEVTSDEWLPLKTFALHEYDEATGLYYAQQRYYDPETASFISEDPAKDGTNYYGYCGGNPTAFVDPYGLYDNGTAREGSNSKSNSGQRNNPGYTNDTRWGEFIASGGKTHFGTEANYRLAMREYVDDFYNMIMDIFK